MMKHVIPARPAFARSEQIIPKLRYETDIYTILPVVVSYIKHKENGNGNPVSIASRNPNPSILFWDNPIL